MRAQIDFTYWGGKRVLVTGHTGFKGGWLTIWLNRLGCNVTGVGLAPITCPSLYDLADIHLLCKSHLIDIRDQSRLFEVIKKTEPEVIFHLAAQALVRQSYRDPIDTISTNIMGTANLLDIIRQTPSVKSVVIVTTDKVYKDNDLGYPHKEGDVLGGHDPYSASKAASELIIDSFRNSYLEESGIHVASVRAGNVIGGGDWAQDRIIPDAIRAWGANKPLTLRNPLSIRPWQHVLEPLYGYIVLAQKLNSSACFSKSYNFGPPPECSKSVEEIINLAGKIWGDGDVVNELIKTQLKETRALSLDSRLAEKELNILPIWDISVSMEKTVQWYKKQLHGSNALNLCLADISKYEAAINDEKK